MQSGKRYYPANTYYILLGALTLLCASIPYLYGWLRTPSGMGYTGLEYGIDDSCVYLSWMRQAQNGHFFLHDQFSTDPQRGVLFNLLYFLLGTLARWTRLPAIVIYHAARVGGGGLFLWAIVAFLKEVFPTAPDARRRAFALICFSAGLGWLWHGYDPARAGQPIDLWQPEAITFLSLYFTPLFDCALALIVVFMIAFLRSERTGRWGDTWPAMVAGALLGNFHSYDVIALFATAFVFRIVCDLSARRLNRAAWMRFIAIGLAALPTTVYVYWATQVEPVFHERAFTSATLSPALRWDLLGFGLPLLLAVFGAFLPHDDGDRAVQGGGGKAFLITWAIVGIVVAYVPCAFQRKLLMGVHIPICCLAGSALAILGRRMTGDFPKIVAFSVVLLSAPSNVIFLLRDCDRLSVNDSSTSFRPYLKSTEWDALNFLRTHTRPEDAVLVSPDAASQTRYPFNALEPYLSVYVPAFAGNVVYDGHWSETGDYSRKLARARQFFDASADDDFRAALLAQNDIRYILYDNRLAAGAPKLTDGAPIELRTGYPYVPVDWLRTPPPYLTIAYRNPDVTVYSVQWKTGFAP